jgi:hypothetical protein
MLLVNAITLMYILVMDYIKDLYRAPAGIPDEEGFWYES